MQSRQKPLISLAVLFVGAASRESAAFAPASPIRRTCSSTRPRPLSMIVDPHDAVQQVGAAADVVQHGDGAQHLSTFLTAAADAAVVGKKYAWEFMGMHGERISPCGGSCPPGFGLTDAAKPGMDYFLPENPTKMDAAIKMQQAARDAGGSMPSIGAVRDALPGGRPEVLPFPAGDPEALMAPIEQDELEMMLRDADITSRLPMVAFAMVLIDFFFFSSGNDVYREDIMEDSPGRAAEWMVAAGTRVGVGIALALATITFSNMFYHPI